MCYDVTCFTLKRRKRKFLKTFRSPVMGKRFYHPLVLQQKMVYVCVLLCIKKLVRLILRVLYTLYVQPSSPIMLHTNFMYERDAIFFQTIHNFLYFLFMCVYKRLLLVSYGEKFIVSIDRTRKNRRGKISSLFLFAAYLLI